MSAKSVAMNLFCTFILAPIIAVLIMWGAYVMSKPDPPPVTNDTVATSTQHTIRPASARPVSGRTVYMAHCAKCHGETGDGQGTEQLDRPARSFLDGGFSFGNTAEAISRVVRHGIAGTPMPGFATTLSTRQIEAVTRYVQRLAPPVKSAGNAALVVVGDRPEVIRAQIPPVRAGLPPHPRGLLLGGTDGLTLQYRADDVRLLAARQGEFARHTAWDGRGGTPVEPLGKLVHAPGGGDPMPTFSLGGEAVHASLTGTSTLNGKATVRYDIPGRHGRPGTVSESGSVVTFNGMPGYQRRLKVTNAAAGLTLALPLSGEATPVALGSTHGWFFWQDGHDLIGVRGAMPQRESPTMILPDACTVDIMVLPNADEQMMRDIGLLGDGSTA